jgi:hypothetical protein
MRAASSTLDVSGVLSLGSLDGWLVTPPAQSHLFGPPLLGIRRSPPPRKSAARNGRFLRSRRSDRCTNCCRIREPASHTASINTQFNCCFYVGPKYRQPSCAFWDSQALRTLGKFSTNSKMPKLASKISYILSFSKNGTGFFV